MRKIYLSVLGLAMASLFLGCSSSNDSAAVSYLEGEPVAITDAESVNNSVSSVASITDSSSLNAIARSTSLAQSFSATLAASRTASLAPETYLCSSGSYTVDATSQTSATIVYSSCSNGSLTQNGSISISGSTITISNYSMVDTTYGTSITMNMTMTGDFNTGADMTMTGTMSFSALGDSGSLGYKNFRVVNNSDGTVNISGDVSITSSSYTCANGTFSIATLSSLTPNYSNGGFSSGTMTVNGVTIEFTSSTTANVTYADGTTESVNQSQPQVCS